MISGFIIALIGMLVVSLFTSILKPIKKAAEDKTVNSRDFSYSKEQVFIAVCKAISTIKNLKIQSMDKKLGIISAKSNISLTSFGEDFHLKIIGLSDNKTRLEAKSSVNGRYWDTSTQSEIIENILDTTYSQLQTLYTN